MTRPRSELISLSDTPFYHCVSRCVRRAFLCGQDHYSGRSYEHRRDWLEEKLLETSSIFAIGLCSYAVMSNHYHVVLHVRTDIAQSWSDYEVVERWHRLFSGTVLSSLFLANQSLSESQIRILKPIIAEWRSRLTSISWYMRIVNEWIARQANAEDECTGRFWEGRFKSQALLDEQALLACMAYVDLNPIRAGIAPTPEKSDYTSIKQRIDALTRSVQPNQSLEPFVGIQNEHIGISYRLKDYLELVDWTARIVREDKRGFMSNKTPNILNRLNLDRDTWSLAATQFEHQFRLKVTAEHIHHRHSVNQKLLH